MRISDWSSDVCSSDLSLRAVISQTLMKKRGGGRVAAHEIMIGTPAIRNLIRENKIAQMYSSIQTGGKEGMQTLDQCLKEMVKKGMTTVEEARMKSADPRSFSINCSGTNREEKGEGKR